MTTPTPEPHPSITRRRAIEDRLRAAGHARREAQRELEEACAWAVEDGMTLRPIARIVGEINHETVGKYAVKALARRRPAKT